MEIREFLTPAVSRSGLGCCLRRYGVGSLHDLEPSMPSKTSKPFKAYDPGYFYIEVKYLP